MWAGAFSTSSGMLEVVNKCPHVEKAGDSLPAVAHSAYRGEKGERGE